MDFNVILWIVIMVALLVVEALTMNLTTIESGLNLLMEPKEMINPSGIAPNRVAANNLSV